MNEQAMRFRLGVFVLGAVVTLAVLIIIFGESPAIFTRQIAYSVRFPEAAGVEEGTPVQKSGIRIGEVTGFDLDPDTGEVTIHIVISEKHRLRVGDQAILARSLILGTTAVNFVPVEGSDKTPAQADHVFQGERTSDISAALGKASDLVPIMQTTLEQVHNTAKSINDYMPQMRRTIEEIQLAARNFGRASERVEVLIETNEEKVAKTLENVSDAAGRAASMLNEENEKAFKDTLKSFRTASESLEKVSKNADLLMTDARKTLKDVGTQVETTVKNVDGLATDARATVKRFNQTMDRGDEVLANLQEITKPIAEKAPTLVKNIEEGTMRFNRMTYDISEFTKSLSEGDGTLRRIVQDPTLYNNLDDMAVTLKRAMTRLDRIMRDIEVFSDKIARHPELLGVGGAVSPSSGLKDSPGAMPTIRPRRP